MIYVDDHAADPGAQLPVCCRTMRRAMEIVVAQKGRNFARSAVHQYGGKQGGSSIHYKRFCHFRKFTEIQVGITNTDISSELKPVAHQQLPFGNPIAFGNTDSSTSAGVPVERPSLFSESTVP